MSCLLTVSHFTSLSIDCFDGLLNDDIFLSGKSLMMKGRKMK